MEGLSNYEKDIRPWGSFERFTLNESSTVKLITVKEGEEFSLQTHAHRDEFWRVISGSGTVILNGIEASAKVGDHFYCLRGTTHRAHGAAGGLIFLEIAFGDFEESDITRLEDKYGRA
ncbi:MAG TPA: phosphomannose isomerase type II C-terminal cupin domain [Candidatus Paceibacterota bacterium]|nr:phosphomannose isomerase type II C-terminal cupin domain [Candidatus Paceibacterota bacterium]